MKINLKKKITENSIKTVIKKKYLNNKRIIININTILVWQSTEKKYPIIIYDAQSINFTEI